MLRESDVPTGLDCTWIK